MHLKVFVKLKKTPKNPKNPLVWAKKPKKTQKTPKKPKKPKKNQKNPKKHTGLGFLKTRVFSNPACPGPGSSPLRAGRGTACPVAGPGPCPGGPGRRAQRTGSGCSIASSPAAWTGLASQNSEHRWMFTEHRRVPYCTSKLGKILRFNDYDLKKDLFLLHLYFWVF